MRLLDAHWATPFEFHTPPVEDLKKKTSPTEECEFQVEIAHLALLNKIYTPSVINLIINHTVGVSHSGVSSSRGVSHSGVS